MARDIITGKWTGPSDQPYAEWTTKRSSARGFAAIDESTNTGRLYIDRNRNGAKDRGDKVIAKLTKIKDDITPYDASGGTWSLDPSTKQGTFFNLDGIDLIAAKFTNLSYF